MENHRFGTGLQVRAAHPHRKLWGIPSLPVVFKYTDKKWYSALKGVAQLYHLKCVAYNPLRNKKKENSNTPACLEMKTLLRWHHQMSVKKNANYWSHHHQNWITSGEKVINQRQIILKTVHRSFHSSFTPHSYNPNLQVPCDAAENYVQTIQGLGRREVQLQKEQCSS